MTRIGRTSDGIELAKWQQLQSLALRYANSVIKDDDVAAERARRAVLRFIRLLARDLGPRPSLLATKSDFVESPSLQERLLLDAYRLAKKRRDALNTTLIASSLATFYFEERRDRQNSLIWIEILEGALREHFDKGEAKVLRDLRKRLKSA